MNEGRIYWLMTIIMTASIAFSLFTGRIRYQGRSLIDRDERPGPFWLHLTGWSVVAIGLLATAVVQHGPT